MLLKDIDLCLIKTHYYYPDPEIINDEKIEKSETQTV